MKSGMNLLFEELVPERVLRQVGLMPDQVAMYVGSFMGLLALIYGFLQLSFLTLVGPSGGGELNSIMQSTLAAGVAVFSKNQRQSKYDERQTKNDVSNNLGHFVGAVAHRSLSTD